MSYFHVFGCKCFILNNGKSQLKAFDSKSDEGIFLGYSSTSKAFRVYNCRTLLMEETPHVVFDESTVGRNQESKSEELGKRMTRLSLKEKESSKTDSHIKISIPSWSYLDDEDQGIQIQNNQAAQPEDHRLNDGAPDQQEITVNEDVGGADESCNQGGTNAPENFSSEDISLDNVSCLVPAIVFPEFHFEPAPEPVSNAGDSTSVEIH